MPHGIGVCQPVFVPSGGMPEPADAVPDHVAFPCRLSGGKGLALSYTRKFVDPADDQQPRNHDNDQAFYFLSRQVPTPGRPLDIGCGNGRLLLMAKRQGWRVKGLELSAAFATCSSTLARRCGRWPENFRAGSVLRADSSVCHCHRATDPRQ
jgi:SAM-dependent methyltransferase